MKTKDMQKYLKEIMSFSSACTKQEQVSME